MKTCTVCDQIYNDDNLNFCLSDGGLLKETKDDAPPTIQMNQVRTTQPNWADQNPSTPWQNQPFQQNSPYAPIQPNQQYAPMMMQNAPMVMQSQNQTLATVSMCLGIASVTIGWCCSTGLILSPAALITGFIALSQIKKDPRLNGGRGMAIAGIVTGSVYLGLLILILIIYGAAFLGSLR